MEIQLGMTVADIGAGTGYFSPWLSRAAGDAGTVLALDVEADMVRYLKERTAREHLSNVRASLVSSSDPKLAAASVDRVLRSTVFYEIDKMPGFIAVPVGAFADPSFPSPTFSMYEARRHGWVTVPDGIEHMD